MLQVKTKLLSLWSDLMTNKSKVHLVGTTNRPWSIDAGFIRRFQKCTFVDIPSVQSLKAMIEHRLERRSHNITETEISTLAEMSHGHTGSDVKTAFYECKNIETLKCRSCRHWKKVCIIFPDFLPGQWPNVALGRPRRQRRLENVRPASDRDVHSRSRNCFSADPLF